MLKIRINDTRGILPAKKVEFDTGLTVLIGCNGAGKSTLLKAIAAHCKNRKTLITLHFDNMQEGGHRTLQRLADSSKVEALGAFLFSSEGERLHQSLENFVLKLTRALKNEPKNKAAVVLLDHVDSGFSLDNVQELRSFLAELKNSFEKGRKFYFIVAANSFAMCKGTQSLDVTNFEFRHIETYEDFETTILESRERKNKRLEAEYEFE